VTTTKFESSGSCYVSTQGYVTGQTIWGYLCSFVPKSCLAAPKLVGILIFFFSKFVWFLVYSRILSITVLQTHTTSICRVENGGNIQRCYPPTKLHGLTTHNSKISFSTPTTISNRLWMELTVKNIIKNCALCNLIWDWVLQSGRHRMTLHSTDVIRFATRRPTLKHPVYTFYINTLYKTLAIYRPISYITDECLSCIQLVNS